MHAHCFIKNNPIASNAYNLKPFHVFNAIIFLSLRLSQYISHELRSIS